MEPPRLEDKVNVVELSRVDRKRTVSGRYVLVEGAALPPGAPKVLSQKTRSKTWAEGDVDDEFYCLRTVVQWMWKKHALVSGTRAPASLAAWMASGSLEEYGPPDGADPEHAGELVIGRAPAGAPAPAAAPAGAPASPSGSASSGSSSSSSSSS